MDRSGEHAPVWLWRASMAILALSLLLVAGLLAATLAGVADPLPVGSLITDDRFESERQWRITTRGGETVAPEVDTDRFDIVAKPSVGTIMGAAPDTIHLPGSLELTVMQLDGAQDAEYGLWWGSLSGQPSILFGVNSDGYMAILNGVPGAVPVRDWQLFPHVAGLGKVNAFRADVDAAGQVTLRLNDEVAGSFQLTGARQVSAGFFVQSVSQGSASFRLLRFRVWGLSSGSQ